jgi:hypothetical protein
MLLCHFYSKTIVKTNWIAKWSRSDYGWIMLAAVAVRLLAVLFSPGYGMHDDHFLIIEASSSWVDGYDYNRWLPWTEGNRGVPEGHSFTYVGLNFIYFSIMKWLSCNNPMYLMFGNRLIHALISLFVVWYGIKITERLSDKRRATSVGWILALLWIMPFVSVRNLVEVAALPFLVLGTWFLIKSEIPKYFFIGGLIIGMAVSFRYQIGVFAIGLAAYYFFRQSYKLFFSFCIGVVCTFTITQGIVDWFIWGYPFAELISYVTYNMQEGTQYLPNQNYFMYFFVLMGCLFVPLGILYVIGFFSSAKRYAILFVPTILFIVFHTLYPNRQERFILSVLPFFIILGTLGYAELKSRRWHGKLYRISMVSFWILNTIFLAFSVTMYSKKSRVEAMYSLYTNHSKNERILLEGSSEGRVSMMPKFYAKSWYCGFTERTDSTADLRVNPELDFDYIFFFGDEQLSKRIQDYKKIYPKMALHKQCHPSLIDGLLRDINPRNANEYIEVWKTNMED